MKAKWYLIVIFGISVLLDIGFSMYGFYINHHVAMETNPLFLYGKSMAWPIVLNLFVIISLYLFYTAINHPGLNFFLTGCIIYGAIARLSQIPNAIMYIQQPVQEAAFAGVTAAQKTAEYLIWATISMILPYIILVIIYFIWSRDYKIEVKE